jgi:hypothetical protein
MVFAGANLESSRIIHTSLRSRGRVFNRETAIQQKKTTSSRLSFSFYEINLLGYRKMLNRCIELFHQDCLQYVVIGCISQHGQYVMEHQS